MPIRLKEVVYTLSPFEQNVMGGLWKDLPHKASHYLSTVSDPTLAYVEMAIIVPFFLWHGIKCISS